MIRTGTDTDTDTDTDGDIRPVTAEVDRPRRFF